MPFYTPNGLKVRLNEEKVKETILPLLESGQYTDILTDVELWEKMPNAISSVMAIIAAVLTKSTIYVFVFGILGYTVGTLIKVDDYSRLLKIMFPQILGSWVVTIVLSAILSVHLFLNKEYMPILALLVIILGNWIGYMNFLEFINAPFRIKAIRRFFKKNGYLLTHVERTFITICNRKANVLGVVLCWDLEKIVES